PPQMIISLSVQIAVCPARSSGTLMPPLAVQLFVLGLYLPPLAVYTGDPNKLPPQTIISRSVQTAVCPRRADGALAVLVIVQLSLVGLYLPPVNKVLVPLHPPHPIISLSDHTAVCMSRPVGALVVLVAAQLSVLGLYLPPVFKRPKPLYPPQIIISVPVHTAVCPSLPEGALDSVV